MNGDGTLPHIQVFSLEAAKEADIDIYDRIITIEDNRVEEPFRVVGAYPSQCILKFDDISELIDDWGVPWKESPYYWWWYALRLNEQYKRVCDKGGKTSNQKLAKVYRDFGDVHGNNSFKGWWRENNRGAELFAEPPAPLRVHTLKQGDLEDYETLSTSFLIEA